MSTYTIDSFSTLADFLWSSTDERAEFTTLKIEISSDNWFRDLDTDAIPALNLKQFESLPECKRLKTVELSGGLFHLNPDLFIALGNAIAKLKGIQINLALYSIDTISDNLKNALSTWPIKKLSLSTITPNSWSAIANTPIQSLDLSRCILTIRDYNDLQMFLTQSETVRGLDVTLLHDDKPRLQAFFDALGAGKHLQALNLSGLNVNGNGEFLAKLDPEDFEKFCRALIQLKKLQFITLNQKGLHGSKRFEILYRNVLSQLPDLQAMSLQDQLSTPQVDGLIATAKLCATQPLLKTFKIVYNRYMQDTYSLDAERYLNLVLSLEKLQNEFNKMGFETKKISSTEYSNHPLSLHKTQLTPHNIPGVLKKGVTTSCGALLAFKFVHKRTEAPVVAEEQPENTLRLSNS